jgi:hypothetical protein
MNRLVVSIVLFATALCCSAVEIPFKYCRGMICVDIAIDGSKSRTLLFDTGNVNSSLMADTAQSLGWKTQPIARDGKPIPGMQRGGEHSIDFGGTKLTAKFLVFDRSVFGDDPPPVEGSIAYTFFQDRRVTIDYLRRTITLSYADNTPLGGKLELITFGKKGPPIVVGSPFTVNGTSVHAQIDTCFTGTLLVYDDAVGKLGLIKNGTPRYFPDTDGGVNMLASSATSLGFSATTLDNNHPTLYFVGGGKNPVNQPDGLFEATVGNALFAHSVVTLDFHSMTLDVKPGK